MIEKYISPFVQAQFPAFYKENGPNFIAFVQAYYEWLEQVGNPINHARNIYEYSDIDNTLDTFITYFKNKYMMSLPSSMLADKRTLAKHILDLYKSKGSLRAYELLFRILFNEDIQIYIPGKDIFKLSDNRYVIPRYIEITDNIYLKYLVGKTINCDNSTAIVDNYYVRNINNRIVNVLTISSIDGPFVYGKRIFCDDLYVNARGDVISRYEYNNLASTEQSSYSLAITQNNAPFIIGSLTSIGIESGGAGFSVGDFLKINGDGSGGVARVVSTSNQNGRVKFDLLYGGSGYSLGATVSVTGGGGSGATFKVGGIVDRELYRINTDKIEDSYNTAIEDIAVGCNLYITDVSGTFYNGDNVYSDAEVEVRPLDVKINVDNGMSNGESISNTALGINDLVAYRVDKDLIYVYGSDVNNANLTTGTIMESNTTGTVITVLNPYTTQNAYGNGQVSFVNSSVITITGDFGYFVPNHGIVSANTGATANVTSMSRNTNWSQFPAFTFNNNNLDQVIDYSLTTYDLEVGTIAFLSQINPGSGYVDDPTVTITEPAILDLKIPTVNGYKGGNALVDARAGSAAGVVVSVDVYDSGFAYSPDAYLYMSSSNSQNQTVVTGRSVVDVEGKGAGFFTNRSGFLSDTQHVIDSMYWQSLSYDIIAQRMLSTYEKFVRDLIHPSGIALYGTFRILSESQNETAQVESFSLQVQS